MENKTALHNEALPVHPDAKARRNMLALVRKRATEGNAPAEGAESATTEPAAAKSSQRKPAPR